MFSRLSFFRRVYVETNAVFFICFQTESHNLQCKIESADFFFFANKNPQAAFCFYASWLSFKCILTFKFSITRQVKARSADQVFQMAVISTLL